MHWLASVTGNRLLGSKFAADDADFRARNERVADAFSRGFRLEDPDTSGPVEFIEPGGSLPSWTYRDLGVVGFDVEHYNDPPGQVCRFDQTTLDYLEGYRDRYFAAVRQLLRDRPW